MQEDAVALLPFSRDQNMNLEIVTLFMGAYPDALTSAGDCTPLQVLLSINEQDDLFRLLVDAEPSLMQILDSRGWSPLHSACTNESTMNPRIVKAMLQLDPGLAAKEDEVMGLLPIMFLCSNNLMDDAASVEVLKLLLEAYPASAKCRTGRGQIPLHVAVQRRSQKFCELLVEAFPESVKAHAPPILREHHAGSLELPIHGACHAGKADFWRFTQKVFSWKARMDSCQCTSLSLVALDTSPS